jgi:hypothetical protein
MHTRCEICSGCRTLICVIEGAMEIFFFAEPVFRRVSFRGTEKEFAFVSVGRIVRCAPNDPCGYEKFCREPVRGRAKSASSPLEYPTQLCDTNFLTGKGFLQVTGKEVNH